jgi:hypothetical protein
MNTTSNQFGLVVAYLLPGFIGLAGIAPFAPVIAAWLQPGTYSEASLGPPVYAILAALTIGMVVSCFRWLLIDHIHHWMGVPPPAWDDNHLEDRIVAFNYVVENHYRYYQFFANTLIAVLFAYSVNRWTGTSPLLGIGTDIGMFILCAALFAGSRDSLTKYYARTSRLIGETMNKGSDAMTNGNHPDGDGKPSIKPRPDTKPERKPEPSPKPEQDKTKAKQSGK